MKWLLWICGAAAALAGAAAAIGAILPARHRATRRARFRASPDAVYAVLAGPPDWRTGVKSFGVLPEEDGRRRWWEQDSHGQSVTFELVEARPGERLAVRIAQDGLPFGGTWTFELQPAGAEGPAGGTAVRITEDGEIYNVIFRFLARYFFGYSGSIETYLRDLGAKFGQAVEIEA
jgi:hypothetical protein